MMLLTDLMYLSFHKNYKLGLTEILKGPAARSRTGYYETCSQLSNKIIQAELPASMYRQPRGFECNLEKKIAQ